MSDADLERAIDAAYQRMVEATTEGAAHVACMEMSRLIARRSAAQVRRMEIERGLVREAP